MAEKTSGKSIYLLVDRREQLILVDTIMYARVVDKLCTIYLTHGSPIRVFLTLSSLLSMLPRQEFLQISRSCMVSLQHMMNINSEAVIMSDGTQLPYTAKKKSSILYAFQQSLSRRARSEETLLWKMDFSTEYRCMDRCPIPFFILEITAPSYEKMSQIVVRYANDAMAALARKPLPQLINHSFEPADAYDITELNNFLTQVAYRGVTKEWYEKHLHTNLTVHVICYQPHYGYCACFIYCQEKEDK